MPTRIVFDHGSEVIAAQSEEDVVHAVRRDHPNPITLEAANGGPLHVNWDHVAFVTEVITTPSEGA
jgi:hypothetical protein